VAGSRAYDEQINCSEFIEKGLDCSSGFFVFRKINAPDKCVGAAGGSYLFQKVQPSGREGKTPALTAQLARESFTYSGRSSYYDSYALMIFRETAGFCHSGPCAATR
jgi:hypothetical protein